MQIHKYAKKDKLCVCVYAEGGGGTKSSFLFRGRRGWQDYCWWDESSTPSTSVKTNECKEYRHSHATTWFWNSVSWLLGSFIADKPSLCASLREEQQHHPTGHKIAHRQRGNHRKPSQYVATISLYNDSEIPAAGWSSSACAYASS